MVFDDFLRHLRLDALSAPNISHWRVFSAREADLRPLPPELSQPVLATLKKNGISALYSHQSEAWDAVQRGENVVLATGTASGKTLAYNLPVLSALTEDPLARALYLFPTKALAQDQLAVLRDQYSVAAAIYDGDTPQGKRKAAREQARIVLSNPDMLHTGILPHHTGWAGFLGRLRFVVIDELHVYRGVFGSHVANVLRRLRRIAAFYGAAPQFILTSATIGNPAELAGRLIEAPVRLIDRDGSARGEKHFLIYNPPVVDEALGLRKSVMREAERLGKALLAADLQSVMFARSRRSVEILLSGMRDARKPIYDHSMLDHSMFGNSMLDNSRLDNSMFDNSRLDNSMLDNSMLDNSMLDNSMLDNSMLDNSIFELPNNESRIANNEYRITNNEPRISNNESRISNNESRISNNEPRISNNEPRIATNQSPIRGYRSGYLPAHRREIEAGLRSGAVRLVVATNALELGIDIGGLGAAILVGYPGTLASTYQQSGRAGRGDAPAVAILMASPEPLDQFLAHHPEMLFEGSPERGLINPDHLLILLNHIRCALFELPFGAGEGFGGLPAEVVQEYLQILAAGGEAHCSEEKVFWMAEAYPAADVSLRSASAARVLLHVEDDPPTRFRARLLGEVDRESALWMVHPKAVYLHEAQQYYVQALDLDRNLATLIPAWLDYFTEPLRETAVEVLSVAEEKEQKAWGEIQVTTQVTGFRRKEWDSGYILDQEPLDLPPSELQTTGYWLSIPEATVRALSEAGLWTNSPNDYGPDWANIRARARARDGYRCQVCGLPEGNGRQHDVHHKTPFRFFMRRADDPIRARAAANALDNLTTLCPACHKKAESNVRMRSGLAGLGYVLASLAPLFLMCASEDLGLHIEPEAFALNGLPTLILYDQIPAGIGFSERLYELHEELLARALEHARACGCEDGCPSCVGPGGENGLGGKAETLALLRAILKSEQNPNRDSLAPGV